MQSSSSRNYHRTAPSNQLTSRSIITHREDAQPNETSSWLPRRLRRPIEPPPVRPAASQTNSHSSHRNTHDLTHSSNPSFNPSKHQSNLNNRSTRYHFASTYRPNHSYFPSRPSSYRPDDRHTEYHSRDPYHLCRHSAYDQSQSNLRDSSSSHHRTSYDSELKIGRHFSSTSSNLPSKPQFLDLPPQRNHSPAVTDSHQPLNNKIQSTVSHPSPHPSDTHQLDSNQIIHPSWSRNTSPYHSPQNSPHNSPHNSPCPVDEPNTPIDLSPPSKKRMRRPHSVKPSEVERVPISPQIDLDLSYSASPAKSSHFESNQDEAPALKKIKISDRSGYENTLRHHSLTHDDKKKVRDPSPQGSTPALPLENQPIPDQETRIVSPRQSQPISASKLLSQSALHASNNDSLGSEPRPNIFASVIVNPSSSRIAVKNLMYDLLGHLGHISNVQLNKFKVSKKFISVFFAITFPDPDAAIRARLARTIAIPHPFVYKENRLVIWPRLNPSERKAFAYLKTRSLNPLTSSKYGPIASCLPQTHSSLNPSGPSACSEINSEHSTPEIPREQDTDVFSEPNDATRHDHEPVQSKQSSNLSLRSPSLEVIHLPPKKANETVVQPVDTPGGRSVTYVKTVEDPCEPPLARSKLHSPDLKPIDNNPAADRRSRMHRSVVAHTHVHKTTTPTNIMEIIRQTLGTLGPIERVDIHEFKGARKGIYFSCTITFDQVLTVSKALSNHRYPIPPPYGLKGLPLKVSSKIGRANMSRSKVISSASEPVSPAYSNSPSSYHPDSSPALSNPTLKDLGISAVEGPSSSTRSQVRMRLDNDMVQSMRSNHSFVVPRAQESSDLPRVSISGSARAQSVPRENSSSDDTPLWNTHPSQQIVGPKKRTSPDIGSGLPDSFGRRDHHVLADVFNSANCDYDVDQTVPSNTDISRSPEVSQNMLWLKGHFRHQIKRKKVERFFRSLFKPFGGITDMKLHRRNAALMDLHVTLKDSMNAEAALQSLHGLILPPSLASEKRPRYLHVSFDYSPGAACLASCKIPKSKSILPFHPNPDESQLESDVGPNPLSPAQANSRSVPSASNSVRLSRCSSLESIEIKEHPNNSHDLTHARHTSDHSASPLSSISRHQADQASQPVEADPTQPELPLRVVKYPIPPVCFESHPSYMSNRLHFKLDKIRLLSSIGETVLDSSWDTQNLILHVVTKSLDPLPFQVQPPGQISVIGSTTRSVSTHSQPTASNIKRDESTESNQDPRQPSATVLEKPSVSITQITKHRTWPFNPLPTFLDDSIFPDFSKTLFDFLTTFFRLWEESRSDLQSLYDESAVFSNILAKQGRKPLAITKSSGWPSIFKSISRLPALSNEPISDLIVDACPYSLHPPRVVCSLHGSFSEFPKNVKRAFDRTLILRPVDTHLRPSEGCLGLLKWITLSDTLTIRKHSTRTEAIVEGFMKKRSSSVCAAMVLASDLAQQVLPDNLQTPQLSGPDTDVRAGSTSSRPLTRSTHSPTRVVSSPLHKVEVSDYFPADHIHQKMNPDRYDPIAQSRVTTENIGAISETIPQSPADLAQMQSQLRAMQAEIQHLKSLSQNPTLFKSTNQEELPLISQSHKLESTNSPLKGSFKVIAPTSCSHVGFGVSTKRLLLPTNLSSYLVVSMRGDILSWDHTHPDNSSQVRLILSGASPTDIVDSACYSNLSQTLIVGSRISKTAKNPQNSSVRLVKLQKSLSGDTLVCQRVELEDPFHDNGVRAIALSPGIMNDTSSITSFLTAGQEKFIALWTVTQPFSHTSMKKIEHYQKDVVRIHTDHTSAIQALAVDHNRKWVLSGGQDGKVYATDLSQSNHQTLFSEEKNHILDIQMNPIAQDTVMITTGNKAPGSQFRYCDLRMAQPVISFGFAPNIHGNIESPIKYQRKGSLRDYLFSYPNGDKGGVLVWDLRYPTVPSSSLNTSNGISIQSYFESMDTIVVLEKDYLTKSEISYQC